MYSFRSSVGPVDLAFTDRYGGASAVPYDELNLGINTADDQGVVAANLRTLVEDFASGSAVADMEQVHGAAVVDAPVPGDRPRCDGLVTAQPDVTLVVRVADCVPVLLADSTAGIVGAAHAGRDGVLRAVVPATVERMRGLGATSIEAWIGPHVCGLCYEVPAALQEQVATVVPATRSTTRQGSPALDLGAGVRAQLEAAGVAVHDEARCTIESPDLYSHRRDGASAGRFAGLIRVRS